jgi:hypothetical protein
MWHHATAAADIDCSTVMATPAASLQLQQEQLLLQGLLKQAVELPAWHLLQALQLHPVISSRWSVVATVLLLCLKQFLQAPAAMAAAEAAAVARTLAAMAQQQSTAAHSSTRVAAVAAAAAAVPRPCSSLLPI